MDGPPQSVDLKMKNKQIACLHVDQVLHQSLLYIQAETKVKQL